MLAGCCSLAAMSSSIWISLSSLADNSSSVSPSAALRATVVEKGEVRLAARRAEMLLVWRRGRARG